MPDRSVPTDAADCADAAKSAARSEPINEKGGRAISLGKASLQHGDFEAQIVTIKFRLLQDDDCVLNRRSVAVQHRNCRVRRILGKAVVAFVPLLDEIGCKHMSCRSYRAVGEHDGDRPYAGHRQLAVCELGSSGIEDRQRWDDLGLSADRLLRRRGDRILGERRSGSRTAGSQQP